MPKTIDLLTVVDPLGLPDNRYTLDTPINQIPMLDITTLNKNVWMLAENNSVISGQGTWNLTIQAAPGDTIRWWDTAVVQDTDEDVIIVGFSTGDNWGTILGTPVADTRGCGVAYIKSGFDFKTLQNLKFAMNSFQNNFISAQVLPQAKLGTSVNYYVVAAKLLVRNVSDPQLKALYRFDPKITIVGS